MRPDALESVTRPVLIDRIVYTTITLACVLIVYDGWANLKVVDVVWVILGPVLAMFISHVYSGVLALQVELRRRPTWAERRRLARSESRFLLLAVPPIAVLLVLQLAGVGVSDSIQVIVILEALSIGFWAGLAAHRARLKGMDVARAVAVGLLIGVMVLTLQVLLQPGKEL